MKNGNGHANGSDQASTPYRTNGSGNGSPTKPRGPAVNPGEFATPDLYFAAYLQTAGVRLLKHERWEGRVHFTFDISISNIEELKSAWISNTGKVPAQPFAHSIRSLKSIVTCDQNTYILEGPWSRCSGRLMLKTCRKCGQTKDEQNDFYHHVSTGKPRSWCKVCTNADNLARQAANTEKNNARAKAWREANPEHWAATKAWREANPGRVAANACRMFFKIEFEEVWQAQNGICAACHRPMKRKGKDSDSVTVDHDHKCCPTMKTCGKCFRGLIHRNCNLLLGKAGDDPMLIRAAIAYLQQWAEKRSEAVA